MQTDGESLLRDPTGAGGVCGGEFDGGEGMATGSVTLSLSLTVRQ